MSEKELEIHNKKKELLRMLSDIHREIVFNNLEDEGFKNLSNTERANVRSAYFNEYISPKLKEDEREQFKHEFFSEAEKLENDTWGNKDNNPLNIENPYEQMKEQNPELGNITDSMIAAEKSNNAYDDNNSQMLFDFNFI